LGGLPEDAAMSKIRVQCRCCEEPPLMLDGATIADSFELVTFLAAHAGHDGYAISATVSLDGEVLDLTPRQTVDGL
jgi:hypothetical protein